MVGGQLAHLEAAEGGGLVGGARHLLDACLAQARIALARHALDHPREGGALEALEEARRRSVGAFAEEVLVDVRLLLAVLLRELLERHVERGAPGVLHAARDRDVRRLVEELLEKTLCFADRYLFDVWHGSEATWHVRAQEGTAGDAIPTP